MKLEQSTEFTYVNNETGEVIQTEVSRTYSRKITAESFYMVFIEHMAPFFKLKRGPVQMLCWLCNHAEFNTGKVTLSVGKRKQMARDLDICINSVTNNLHTLKKVGLIAGEEREFIINPLIFWKGDLKTREQVLKDNTLQIQFSLVPITGKENEKEG